MLERYLRPMWAFVFRDWHLTRRYMSWVAVFVFYAIVNSATIALIGKAQDDFRLTLTLLLGVLLWSFLSAMYNEIANSISYERWEGTLEYTFMAPVSRLIHLTGVSLFAIIFSVIRTIVILVGLVLFIQVSVTGANLLGVLVVLLVASLAFMGLGLMAASGTAAGGEVKLKHTHVDEGWIKKWGPHNKPINHVTCGFVAAMFAAAFARPARSYHVTETASIVMGAAERVHVAKDA